METTTLTQEITQLHAELCSALADRTRLFILYSLAEQPCNVTELTQKLDLPQPSVSRHLKVLRDAGLAHSTRQGMSIKYELADKRVIEALDLLRSVLRERIQHHADLMDEFVPS